MIEIFSEYDVLLTKKYGIQNSPCSRRRYGAMLKHGTEILGYSANYRLGNYCTDEYCIRTRRKAPHCEMVELGGEIHAEQALMINWGMDIDEKCHVLLVATSGDHNFYGIENIPCHVCAMMLKYAGIQNVWFPYQDSSPRPTSIDEVLEFYERDDD